MGNNRTKETVHHHYKGKAEECRAMQQQINDLRNEQQREQTRLDSELTQLQQQHKTLMQQQADAHDEQVKELARRSFEVLSKMEATRREFKKKIIGLHKEVTQNVKAFRKELDNYKSHLRCEKIRLLRSNEAEQAKSDARQQYSADYSKSIEQQTQMQVTAQQIGQMQAHDALAGDSFNEEAIVEDLRKEYFNIEHDNSALGKELDHSLDMVFTAQEPSPMIYQVVERPAKIPYSNGQALPKSVSSHSNNNSKYIRPQIGDSWPVFD